MVSRYRKARILELFEKEGKDRIHYVQIASYLKVSPSFASLIAKQLAYEEPSTFRYDRGYLFLEEEGVKEEEEKKELELDEEAKQLLNSVTEKTEKILRGDEK